MVYTIGSLLQIEREEILLADTKSKEIIYRKSSAKENLVSRYDGKYRKLIGAT